VGGVDASLDASSATPVAQLDNEHPHSKAGSASRVWRRSIASPFTSTRQQTTSRIL